MERTIQLGRGPFGTAHSQRMGVISSALPGLSDRGGGKNENEEPAGRDRKLKREMAAKKTTGERQKGHETREEKVEKLGDLEG